jgi:predicted nicotinamide N-methyase
MTAANAERNDAELETLVCSWTEPAPLLERAPWDLVLASDVLYEARNGEALLPLLPQLTSEVWLADPGRPASVPFLAKADRDWDITTSGTVHRLRKRQPVAT